MNFSQEIPAPICAALQAAESNYLQLSIDLANQRQQGHTISDEEADELAARALLEGIDAPVFLRQVQAAGFSFQHLHQLIVKDQSGGRLLDIVVLIFASLAAFEAAADLEEEGRTTRVQ